jgi:hypothetical protein
MCKNGMELEIENGIEERNLPWRCGTWLINIVSDIWGSRAQDMSNLGNNDIVLCCNAKVDIIALSCGQRSLFALAARRQGNTRHSRPCIRNQ